MTCEEHPRDFLSSRSVKGFWHDTEEISRPFCLQQTVGVQEYEKQSVCEVTHPLQILPISAPLTEKTPIKYISSNR